MCWGGKGRGAVEQVRFAEEALEGGVILDIGGFIIGGVGVVLGKGKCFWRGRDFGGLGLYLAHRHIHSELFEFTMNAFASNLLVRSPTLGNAELVCAMTSTAAPFVKSSSSEEKPFQSEYSSSSPLASCSSFNASISAACSCFFSGLSGLNRASNAWRNLARTSSSSEELKFEASERFSGMGSCCFRFRFPKAIAIVSVVIAFANLGVFRHF